MRSFIFCSSNNYYCVFEKLKPDSVPDFFAWKILEMGACRACVSVKVLCASV